MGAETAAVRLLLLFGCALGDMVLPETGASSSIAGSRGDFGVPIAGEPGIANLCCCCAFDLASFGVFVPLADICICTAFVSEVVEDERPISFFVKIALLQSRYNPSM